MDNKHHREPDGATVHLSMRGPVAVIAMQDGRRHNALTAAHVRALLDAMAESRRLGARALVITSAVKNFCAGADVVQLLAGTALTPGQVDGSADTPMTLFRTLQEDPRPVISAIHGLALGGGVELALSSDLVFASPDAVFAMPELGLGLLPRMALVRLAEVVGRRQAMALILTRRRFAASEALSMGLLNSVVAAADLVDTTCGVAEEIVSAPPAAVAAAKRRLGRVPAGDWQAIDQLLADLDPGEWREGLNAFLDKRPADFDPFWRKAAAHR